MRYKSGPFLIVCTVLFSGSLQAQNHVDVNSNAVTYTVESISSRDETLTNLFPAAARAKRLQELIRASEALRLGDATAYVHGASKDRAVGTICKVPGAFVFRPGEHLWIAAEFYPTVWAVDPSNDAVPGRPPQVLPLPAGSGRGIAIAANDAGQTAGEVGFVVTSLTAPPRTHNVISYGQSYSNGKTAIQYTYDRQPRSVVWNSDGSIVILPPFGKDLRCCVNSINNHGDIVGKSVRPESYFRSRAVLWRHNKPIDLNLVTNLTAGEELASASYINDAGQILAISTAGKGKSKFVLLTPRSAPARQ